MMIEVFNNLPWHDAELKEVNVIRNGKDLIQIHVLWPNANDEKSTIIEFYDCYGFEAKMNFGFISPDSILDAEVHTSSPELVHLKNLWNQMGVNLSGLLSFKIYTNTSNGILNIMSLGFRVRNE